MFIVIGASILSSYLAVMGVPGLFAELVFESGLPPMGILILIYLLYIILGCFIDGMSAMILTLPTVLPIIITLGFDPIWFGVILTVLIEVGMITPPMGLNLFVIQGISKRSLTDVILGSVPFFLIMFVGIALFTIFPSIIMWLPTLFFGS
jgi:TRAP-type C4-dicarboxylate transport system permease large subunit